MLRTQSIFAIIMALDYSLLEQAVRSVDCNERDRLNGQR